MNGIDLTRIDDDAVFGDSAPLPRIADVIALEDRRVLVTWAAGEAMIVDLAPALASRSLFIRLRTDDALFRAVKVNDRGNALEWDDGAELSAIWIRRLGPATFDNDEFRAAMATLGMSLDGMSAALQVSRRLVAAYRKDKPIPRHIALATKYLVERVHS